MSAIAPNGEVLLLKGVHLDKSYNHTYRFSNEQAQINYFKGFVKPNMRGIKNELITFNLTNQLYQRVGQNIIRVGIGCDYLYDINYMMFKNNLFQVGKWFYAFVDEVRYVNPNCSEVVYTIDVMQTWKFDYELGACFVEREHSVTDEIGDNIIPENFNVSDYTVINHEKYGTNETTCLIIGTTNIDSKIHTYGNVFNNVYTGLKIAVLDRPNIPDLYSDKEWGEYISSNIQSIFTNEGGIASVLMIPKFLGDLYQRTIDGDILIRTLDDVWEIPFSSFFVDENGNEYSPINKKLLTYPYHFAMLTNFNGEKQEYKFENFEIDREIGNKIKLKIDGCLQPYPAVSVSPINYCWENISRINSVYMSDFIECNYVLDNFTTWWNTNKYKFMYSTLANAFSVGTGAITTGVGALRYGKRGNVGVISSGEQMTNQGLQGLVENGLTYAQQKSIPDTISSSLNTNTIKTITGTYGFGYYEKGIKPQIAKTIDDYFNMFGYAINEVKVPQTTSRPYWNYVKTNGCIVHAVNGRGLPADAEQLISSIYDNGITFWNSDIDIGDYSYARQNRPIQEV